MKFLMNRVFFKKSLIVFALLSAALVAKDKKPEAVVPPTPLESLLLDNAFPTLLDRINDEGVKEPSTLARALGCCAKQSLTDGEKVLDAGVVENCSLLDAVAHQMTKDMVLSLGKAAFARESVVIKSRAAIEKFQSMLARCSAATRDELKALLAPLKEHEEAFLELVGEKEIKNPTDFDVSMYFELAVGEVLPVLFTYFRTQAIEPEERRKAFLNGANNWILLNSCGYVSRLSRPLFKKLNDYGEKKLLPDLRKAPDRATAVMHLTTLFNLMMPVANAYLNETWGGQGWELTLTGNGYDRNNPRDAIYYSTPLKIYLLHMWTILMTYKWVIEPQYEVMKNVNAVHAKLVHLAHMVRGGKKLYTFFKKHSFLDSLADNERVILEKFFAPQAQGDCADLAALAESSTFNASSNFVFHWGRVGRMVDIIINNKKELCELAYALGYGEYVLHISSLVNAQGDENNHKPWSYAQLSDAQAPELCAQNLWYPGLNFANAVTTSVNMSDRGTANILITGVNGSGKSIVMSAVMLAAVCGQTHGIVPASDARCSYFDTLFFHGNLADVKGGGLSKGLNEMKNAIDIIKAVNQNTGKALIMFDELFSSTDSASAELLASLVIKKLIANKNVMLVATTHNPGLREQLNAGRLLNTHQGTIENAVVETNVTSAGDVEYRRQLVVPGVNRDKPALYIMRGKLKEAGLYDDEMAQLLDNAIATQQMGRV